MITTANGIKIPQDDEQGNVWSKAIEEDLVKVDELITKTNELKSSELEKLSTVIDKANWAVDPNGKGYVQNVSVPTGIDLSKIGMRILINSGPRINQEIYPTITPLSLSVFTLLVNNETLDLKVLYV